MFIKKLQVFNYKSYLDSGLMEFSPGINIIVGRNNAGKTSLLEVLSLDFDNYPHRSIKTLPNKVSIIKENKSRVEIIWQIKTEEVRKFIKNWSPNIGIPEPKKLSFIGSENHQEDDLNLQQLVQEDYSDTLMEYLNEALSNFKNKLENQKLLEIRISLYSNRVIDDISLKKLLSFESFEAKFNSKFFYRIESDELGEISLSLDVQTQEDDASIVKPRQYEAEIYESIGCKIFKIFLSRIYRFQAERLNIGICKYENKADINLTSNASNLAEVLFILQGKIPGMFAQFNKLVSDVLSEIK